jgi:hypothetical protein
VLGCSRLNEAIDWDKMKATMTRSLALVLTILFAGMISNARAQVAVSDLMPASPGLFLPQRTTLDDSNLTPDNPSALEWGAPSRVASGLIFGTDNDRSSPPAHEFKGEFAGARLYRSGYGIAVEQTTVKYDSGSGLESLDQSVHAQVSLAATPSLALGAGVGKLESDLATSDLLRFEAGLSARFGEVWYAGLGLYSDALKPRGSSVQRHRNGTLLGLALRIEQAWSYYLAYDWIQLNDFDTIHMAGQTTGRFTAQLFAPPLMLGVSEAGIDLHGSPDVFNRSFEIGWKALPSLAVSTRYNQTNSKGPTPQRTVESSSIALAWEF